MGQRIDLEFSGMGALTEIPISLVAEKLRALQNLLFHAAATVTRDRRGRSGAWANRHRHLVELVFRTAHHSDLTIETELPESGDRVAQLVFKALATASQGGDLRTLVDEREERLFLLRALEELCPGPMQDYQIRLRGSTPDTERPITLTSDTRRSLRCQVSREIAPVFGETETIVGTLTQIHVLTQPQFIAVKMDQREETVCYFNDSMRDTITNLAPGGMVEVTGTPVRNVDGKLLRLDTVIDADMVSMDPLRLTRLQHEGVRHDLRQPLIVSVDFTGGVWVYCNEELNLWGYAQRRVDAIRELHANFDHLWREFAEEDDAVLDDNARKLKRRLLDLVEPQPVGR